MNTGHTQGDYDNYVQDIVTEKRQLYKVYKKFIKN